MRFLRAKLGSDGLLERVLWTTVLFLAVFIGGVAISYYLLPDGLLKNKHPLQSWSLSDHTLALVLQIFFYNLLSVLIISLASLFASRRQGENVYVSVGYSAFFTLILINSMVLGTWSFAVDSEALPLAERILGSFDMSRRAALWEMLGQLVITCANAHIAVIQISGKETRRRSLREARWSGAEKGALLLGLAMMLTGAVVEALAIRSLG